MCGPLSNPVDAQYLWLRGSERRQLQRLVRRHTAEQRQVLRARIILYAALGLDNLFIARKLACDPKTVRKWRCRFVRDRLAGLEDAPRSGRPRSFSVGQRHELFTLVVGEPPKPYTTWTMTLLADELIGRGIVTTISRATISEWLRTVDIKPHRLRYWLNSKDPDFRAKRDRVISLYINRPARGRVICIDEKTSIQALERCAPDKPVRSKSPRKVEFEYRRHGTANLLAAFDVHTGEVFGEVVVKNDSQAFINFLKRLRKLYPRETLYLILDNGTTHRSHATTEFLASYKRLIPVFLPTHASWLNQVELWFSALTRQALKNASFASRDELVARILHYIESHNAKAKPYRWTSKGEPLRR
jgi:transposase